MVVDYLRASICPTYNGKQMKTISYMNQLYSAYQLLELSTTINSIDHSK